ncbi:MAG: LytTR family DNA-binding domain-containing protein [Bacteroidales bacterium]|nr:LytTR family DNA-binding domain-containing protein [Bacteroidales bacterium]
MNGSDKIKVAIIDDNKEFIESLIDYLIVFPELELCGTATRYRPARELLLTEKPDLVFLDVEMPEKNGFELLNEVRAKGATFNVIFYTAYDKYMIQALRESAFDYILKPVDPDELRNAVNRFKGHRAAETTTVLSQNLYGNGTAPMIIALPTIVGLKFVDTNRILLFRSIHGSLLARVAWEVLLTDTSVIKLGAYTNAERILQLLSKQRFLQINQSCIINLNFLSTVEFKTHSCVLMPPYDKLELTVSRSYLSKLKEAYEVF